MHKRTNGFKTKSRQKSYSVWVQKCTLPVIMWRTWNTNLRFPVVRITTTFTFKLAIFKFNDVKLNNDIQLSNNRFNSMKKALFNRLSYVPMMFLRWQCCTTESLTSIHFHNKMHDELACHHYWGMPATQIRKTAETEKHLQIIDGECAQVSKRGMESLSGISTTTQTVTFSDSNIFTINHFLWIVIF